MCSIRFRIAVYISMPRRLPVTLSVDCRFLFVRTGKQVEIRNKLVICDSFFVY